MDADKLPFVLNRIDLAATFLFSMTGAMVGIRRKYDFVGVFVLALCTGIGGGLLRDGLFIQHGPPAAMRSASFLWAVLAGCLSAALFQRSVIKLNRIFLYADALGLAAYGVVGMTKSLEAGLSPLTAIFVGVVNAAGGSVIRDVLTGSEPLVFKPGQLYALASLLGVSTGAFVWKFLEAPVLVAEGCAIATTFAIRVLSIHFNWKSRVILHGHESEHDRDDLDA